ncbi:MAG: anti-sigma factor domain-containing protein [Candidatus Pristimantibacillus sp.]
MNRGVVMQVNKKKAVVMTADGRFVSIPLQSEMQVGEEVVFHTSSTIKLKPRKTIWYGGIAASILLLILPIFLFFQTDSHPVVAYVSMDINPSIEIGVDGENRVRELRALNDDGKTIVADVSYKGQSLEKVAIKLMEKISGSHYLDNPSKDIVITSLLLDANATADYETALSGKVDGAVRQKLAQVSSEQTANVTTISIPVELRDEAAANGISSGKMAVYLMAKSEGYTFTLESFQKQSIDQVTKSVDGGVKTIVEKSENMSKEKLKELVEKEKKEKLDKEKEKNNKIVKDAAATSMPSISKPTTPSKDDKSSNTTKPSKPKVTEGPKPTPGKTNSNEGNAGKKETNKPSSPQRPNKPEKSDSDKNSDHNHSNDKNNGNSDDDDDDEDKDEDKDDDKDREDRDEGNWNGSDWDSKWEDRDRKDNDKGTGDWNKGDGQRDDDHRN